MQSQAPVRSGSHYPGSRPADISTAAARGLDNLVEVVRSRRAFGLAPRRASSEPGQHAHRRGHRWARCCVGPHHPCGMGSAAWSLSDTNRYLTSAREYLLDRLSQTGLSRAEGPRVARLVPGGGGRGGALPAGCTKATLSRFALAWEIDLRPALSLNKTQASTRNIALLDIGASCNDPAQNDILLATGLCRCKPSHEWNAYEADCSLPYRPLGDGARQRRR